MGGRARGWVSGALALVFVGLVIALGSWAGASDELVKHSGHLPLWTFIGVALVLAGFIIVVGWGITGKVGGFLIDGSKGRMSLSALQVSLWTVLVLAAYFNAFVINLAAGSSDPLSVTIPADLLIAMGISVGSLAGSGIVQNFKGTQDNPSANPAPNTFAAVLSAQIAGEFTQRAGGQAPTIDASKRVLRIAGFSAASWRDLFEGEGPLTATTLDLGKVQMFFFTIVLVLGYAITVANLYGGDVSKGVTALPQLDQAFIGLLTISQIGYLATKAAGK